MRVYRVLAESDVGFRAMRRFAVFRVQGPLRDLEV